MALYPLLSTHALDLEYLLLDEALADGSIEVEEVDNSGSVPELKVINNSPQMVLILDGEELVGAKQNRIINTTILIQGKSTTVIPVSCVEQGRWSYESPKFHSERRMMSSNLRAMKSEQVHASLRVSSTHRSDQGAIWNEISDKASRRAARSPSMAMSEIYEKDRPEIQEYMKHFRLTDSQVGALFMINKKHKSFSKVFKKLVESYALDAIDWFEPEKEHKSLRSEVTNFIKVAQSARIDSHGSVGLGTDLRMESRNITGFALELDDQILHLCIFIRENGRDRQVSSSRLERFSRRRGYRV